MNYYQLFWDENMHVVAAVAGAIPDWKQREWRVIMGGRALPESIVEGVVEQIAGKAKSRLLPGPEEISAEG